MIRALIMGGIGGLLAIIGLMGLLIPILPGIPLLVLAAVCFSAASPTFGARLERHPTWRGWRARWRASRGLSVLARARLAFWLTAEAVMNLVRRP